MFYLKDSKVYLTEKNSETNKYPEVELVVTSIDTVKTERVNYNVVVKGEGESSKPSERQVIDMEEFIAKFGDEAMEYYLLPTYEVTFNTNGHGTAPSKQQIKEGYPVVKPTDPDGGESFTFAGWYKEAAGTNSWNFSTDLVQSNTTLYAKWTEIEANE